MEYDLSKNINIMDLVHNIKLGIKMDAVFDVQSKGWFDIVDYCLWKMYFVIKQAYLLIDKHRGNWSINQIYYLVSFVGHNVLLNPS